MSGTSSTDTSTQKPLRLLVTGGDEASGAPYSPASEGALILTRCRGGVSR